MNTVKLIFAVALLLVGLSFIPANAQKADANVTVTKVIDASADEVWSVLRKMDDIDKYSSLIGKVEWTGEHGVGGERLCLPTKDGEGFFKERRASTTARHLQLRAVGGSAGQGHGQ